MEWLAPEMCHALLPRTLLSHHAHDCHAPEMCFLTMAEGTRSSLWDRHTSACCGMSSGHSISSCHWNFRQNVCAGQPPSAQRNTEQDFRTSRALTVHP